MKVAGTYCVQCARELTLFRLASEHGADNVFTYVCQHADCPNYGLLQTGILTPKK